VVQPPGLAFPREPSNVAVTPTTKKSISSSNSHASYYPGAKMISLKVIFRKSDGKLLGAQAFGEDGSAVDKRISALAVFLQMGAIMDDLAEAELRYAPQFGSAKDPVNFAGMIAGNVLRGDMPMSHWDSIEGAFLLNVRNPSELVLESVPGAVNIPLPQLRSRLGDLPKDRAIKVICRSAQRAYYATRMLLQNGFQASTIAGGYAVTHHEGNRGSKMIMRARSRGSRSCCNASWPETSRRIEASARVPLRTTCSALSMKNILLPSPSGIMNTSGWDGRHLHLEDQGHPATRRA